MREQVKLAVLSELQEWFVAIRVASRAIGAKAMERFRQAQAQAAEARSLELGHPVDPLAIPPEDVDVDAEDVLAMLQPGQPGSLVPVYQCLHAHDVLGERSAFEVYYAENRRVPLGSPGQREDIVWLGRSWSSSLLCCAACATIDRQLQAELALTPVFDLAETSLGALSDYLAEVVGYFVVETVVSAGTQSSYLKSALVRGRASTRPARHGVGG